jgi:hypothetical protein
VDETMLCISSAHIPRGFYMFACHFAMDEQHVLPVLKETCGRGVLLFLPSTTTPVASVVDLDAATLHPVPRLSSDDCVRPAAHEDIKD